MPIYEYRCQNCGKEFELLRRNDQETHLEVELPSQGLRLVCDRLRQEGDLGERKEFGVFFELREQRQALDQERLLEHQGLRVFFRTRSVGP